MTFGPDYASLLLISKSLLSEFGPATAKLHTVINEMGPKLNFDDMMHSVWALLSR